MESELKECLQQFLEMSQYYTKEEVNVLLETIKNQLNPYKMWVGTQQEYVNITAKDINTLYFVRGE